MLRKLILRISGITIVLMCVSLMAAAQPDGNDDDPPPDVPLDGGTSILIGAGVAYGIKKIRDNKTEAHKKKQ